MRQRRWIFYKIAIFLVVVLIAAGSIHLMNEMKKNEAIVFVEKMGVGWNLGNTLDTTNTGLKNEEAHAYETYWGNPQTTREMIKEIHDAGFSTIRIPITWKEHMDEDGKIDADWMKRVHEVVDYSTEEDLFVIINTHHDDWYYPSYENESQAIEKMKRVWDQISTEFIEHDDYLLFEAMNEPRLIGTEDEWTTGTNEAQIVINHLNQAFVRTVRDSGGYNSERYLLIPTYCASGKSEALKALDIPDDRRIIVSLHQYIPYDFALNDDGTDKWDFDKKKDTEDIDDLMTNIKELFVDKGVPVIISEFGAVDKENLEERLEWLSYYKKKADAEKVMLIWWDAGGNENKKSSFRIFDRNTLKWIYPEIKNILTSS